MSESNSLLHSMFPDLDFDPDQLREKYRRERDRRIRGDGQGQYVEAARDYARYANEDPFVEFRIEREPLDIAIDVAIVGAGFSGLMAAVRLKEMGIDNLKVIDAAANFGGTWYWNRYPGAQCDVDSYCYLPLLEETGYMPKEKYSFAPEIYEHSQRIGEHFDLYPNAVFQTRVTELRWDDEANHWKVSTDRGDNIRARFAIQATGPLSRPKLPGVPGIGDFKGHSFHTCRWDYNYTGGDSGGWLTRLADKKVAVIGTGATAIQCVPHLGKYAKELYVFQRTPSSVDLRGNKPTDAKWFNELQPGWQRERRDNFSAMLLGEPVEHDLVADGWTEVVKRVGLALMARDPAAGNLSMEEIDLRAEVEDFRKMNEIRQRIDDTVQARDKAELLKPWFRQFCKRPTFNDEYLETFNRDNVHLIDTSETRGVEQVTERGIVANGREYELDCIIFATGYEMTSAPHRRVDYQTYGRNGQSLFDHWSRGFRTLHGMASHGFPNWFTIGINQNGLSPNFTGMFDDQATHIAYVIDQVFKRGMSCVEVTAEAEAAWVKEIIDTTNVSRNSFLEACTPGVFNGEGARTSLQNSPYGPGINAFNKLIQAWRDADELEGLQLS